MSSMQHKQLANDHVTSQNASAINQTSALQQNGHYEPRTQGTLETTDIKSEQENKLKNDESTKIKRPMNPFMIFGCEKRRKLAQVHPRMHNSEISKILGAEWKRMSDYDKSPYILEAKRLKEQHSIEYPNYKFKANRRKPRQAIKKERPSFPYAADINTIPTAMKFPYPSPFFQDSMYGTMYPVMGNSNHPAYSSMYSDFARQSMSSGGVLRTASAAPTTTASAADYYSLNKNASPIAAGNDYYGALSSKNEYYSGLHSSAAETRAERSSSGSGADIINLSDRYPSSESRQFENRYSSSFVGGQGASGSSVVVPTYTSIQNIPHLNAESSAVYSYSNLYEQRH